MGSDCVWVGNPSSFAVQFKEDKVCVNDIYIRLWISGNSVGDYDRCGNRTVIKERLTDFCSYKTLREMNTIGEFSNEYLLKNFFDPVYSEQIVNLPILRGVETKDYHTLLGWLTRIFHLGYSCDESINESYRLLLFHQRDSSFCRVVWNEDGSDNVYGELLNAVEVYAVLEETISALD